LCFSLVFCNFKVAVDCRFFWTGFQSEFMLVQYWNDKEGGVIYFKSRFNSNLLH